MEAFPTEEKPPYCSLLKEMQDILLLMLYYVDPRPVIEEQSTCV